jgi:predicted AlkP superfamily pyrophosphatase or phosphodiesterase
MKKLLIILFSVPVLMHYAWSQQWEDSGRHTPKIVLGIVVENMRPDYVERYWNRFQEDGFKKLWSGGTRFADFRMLQPIQNCASGTATLFTGTYPLVHGIIDNTWYDRKEGKAVNCVADEKYATLGGSASPGYSPHFLKSPTLGDQLKLYSSGKSRIYSLAINPPSAIFSAGFSGDAAWWFDPSSGNMVTSTYYMEQLPSWVIGFNQKKLAKDFSEKNWALLKSPSDYKESSMDNEPTEEGYGAGRKVFPHSMADLIKEAGDFSPLKTTPYANSIISQFAASLLDNEPVGEDDYTDLITVTFSSMDFMNGAFGPASVEMEDLYLKLDQEIASLVHQLEKKCGKENLLIFLTSDMAASYSPNYLKEKLNFPAGTFSPEGSMALLNSYLNLTYGDLPWIAWNNSLQLYLNHKLVELNKIEINNIREKIATFLLQFEGIESVVTADMLNKGSLFSFSQKVMSNGFFPARSGDILYLLTEGWQPVYKNKIINYTDQYRLPLVIYGTGISHHVILNACEAPDFLTTISHLLKIPTPNRCQGNIIGGF